MTSTLPFQAARTPRILWVELTSKCPFDCIFCSRQLRRGAGQHLPFDVYSSLLESLVDPRKFILNYSGESTVYPDLIAAIERARSTGAFVELVSVMATAPESLLGPLSRSGLDRLTVSVHAIDNEKFAEIYRHSSFETLRSRLERFMELCRAEPRPPVVDLAFVAMETNLAQLPSVTSFANGLGLRDVMIFPVMRRDEIPAQFPNELTVLGAHRPDFKQRVRATVNAAAEIHPEIRFTICNESFKSVASPLGEVPVPYPQDLPPGAYIHSCEQNPWETAHVLSGGDVVACEVLDKIPLGNLLEQSIGEIWHGAPYQDFRRRYRRGEVAECRSCPWKRAYRPGSLKSEILAARGRSAQLLYGWHEPSGEGVIWSSQQAMAVLAPRPGSRTVHISGMLPPGPENDPNQLTIRLNGRPIGTVTNPWGETIPFGLDFPVTGDEVESWVLEFRATHVCRPSERGDSPDQRDLGFALVLITSTEFVEPERTRRQEQSLQPLARSVQAVDRWGARLRRLSRHAPAVEAPLAPGLSIVIPERDNRDELTACLASVREAAWTEPLETIVVASGSPQSGYGELRKAHPDVRWLFHARPLEFAQAVRAGLDAARYDWVYLLNNDVALDPGALRALAPHRGGRTFSIASQIMFKDTTRFRDETNWTTLLVESGLAAIHDWIPGSEALVPTFYAGGGASMFQTRLLRALLDASAYAPFYWEDVEWGWRARKLGYESWFCPSSVAHHTRRATVDKYYSPAEVDRIIRRNGLLFQLRNFTTAGLLERVIEEISRAPEPVASHFITASTRWKIACGRLWNHRAAFTDEEVFARWSRSLRSAVDDSEPT
jgi:radical SAM protein with 4Fe4S-binding SPASM domain